MSTEPSPVSSPAPLAPARDGDAPALSRWTQVPGQPAQYVRTVEGGDPANPAHWRARAWRAVAVYDPDEVLESRHPRDLGWLCMSPSKAKDGTDHRAWADKLLRRLGYILPEDEEPGA